MRFICVVACTSSSFLFITEWYAVVLMYYNLSVHSSVDGHLRFQFEAIMNKAAMNIHVQVFMWSCVFLFLDKYLRSGIAAYIVNTVYV